MPDKTLVCKDCRQEFVFTEGEQAFYKEKGFENEPQRCPECRRARKAQRRNGNFGNSYSTGSRW
ncbi:MAG TPA: zinc-ribbon domain-containing protein [Clostridiales bacterium]|nr:zinc-ribbon domain-containing protein [Clostridiales bacterium]HPV02630.1 zinc-ribbon domain-containing protein [Clostridiales bacterium]